MSGSPVAPGRERQDRQGSNFSFTTLAHTIKSATSVLGDATSRLGSNMGVTDINLESIRSVTTNVASNMNLGNFTSNLTNMQSKVQEMASFENIKKVQEMASLENLQEGFQAVGGGIQTGLGGLEAMSKTIIDNLAEKKKSLTNVEALKAKGNYQLIGTIKTIEYQILMIFVYFILAFFINWYWAHGVAQTVTLMKNSRQFLDDPELEKKFLNLRDSIGSDLKKYSDLNQLKQGMDGLRNGIAQRLQDGAKIVQDGASVLSAGASAGASVLRENIALDKFNLLSEGDQGKQGAAGREDD